MFRKFRFWFLAAGLTLVISGAALADLPSIMDDKDVLPYLDQMIDWHRRALALEVPAELPRLLLIRHSLDQHATKALDESFEFAHALGANAKDAPKPPDAAGPATAAPGHNIHNAVRKAEKQIHDLQAALVTARDGAAHTNLDGQLKLAEEHLNLLKTIASSIADSSDDTDTLDEKIQKLDDSVKEVENTAVKPGESVAPVIIPAQASSGGGMAGLITDLYGFIKARQEVKSLRSETAAMLDINRARSLTIRAAMQDLMKQGADIGKAKPGPDKNNDKNKDKTQPSAQAAKAADTGKPDPESDAGQGLPPPDGAKTSTSPADAAAKPADASKTAAAAAAPPAPPPTYDELLSDMKKLTRMELPLSQLDMALDATTRDLSQWADTFAQQIHDLTRHLFVRLGVMAAVIAGLCLLSALFGRATRRYVLDDRRKIQLRTVRKMVLISSVMLVVFVAFFTDFSSLATFAGLLTAGLAVALQTVLLSLIAFFHFFGSFGIRVGDRITISGVTGRVMQIGMVRFYLMELVRSDVGYLPTGRVVGFSNSILFQPLPFFRQTPGTNFVWSEISLTLDPSIDYESAHKKLEAVVHRVYAKQREIMQRQEVALLNITHFKAVVSEPQMYLKITGGGLVLTIRYAVQREQEADLHLQMTEELLTVIKKDPELKFVNIG